MAIDYSKNITATVGVLEGAPRYYVRGDQVYRQDLTDDGEFLDPNSEVHVDWGITVSGAMKKANILQANENAFVINKNNDSTKMKKKDGKSNRKRTSKRKA